MVVRAPFCKLLTKGTRARHGFHSLPRAPGPGPQVSHRRSGTRGIYGYSRSSGSYTSFETARLGVELDAPVGHHQRACREAARALAGRSIVSSGLRARSVTVGERWSHWRCGSALVRAPVQLG